MHDKQDFTLDQYNFPVNKFNELLKDVRYIPIIDAGISIKTGFAMEKGKQLDIFMKDKNK